MTRRHDRRPRIAIVGAGIGGLAAADTVRRLAEERGVDLELLVFDAAARVGGCAGTESFEGARLERGPDTLVTHKPAGLRLCERLGLGARLEHPPASSVAVWHQGRLLPIPSGFALLAPTRRRPLLSSPLLSWPGRLRAWCEPLVPPRRGASATADESVAAFVRRRFGDELYRRITEPLVGSISMSDVESLSMAATFPRFAALELQPGRISGRRAAPATPAPAPAVAALAGGMSELVDALAARLPAASLRLSRRVTALARTSDDFELGFDDGPRLSVSAVVVATPAPVAAILLRALDSRLADQLAATCYASCATVNLAWPRSMLANTRRLHGFFLPRDSGLPFVAAGILDTKFPARVPDGLSVVRAFCGGALNPDVLELPDAELVERVARAIAPLLGARGAPVWQRVFRHPESMPQVTVGHLDRVREALRRAAEHPGLGLAGGPLGAYGLPDVIAAAESAATTAIDAIDALGALTPRA